VCQNLFGKCLPDQHALATVGEYMGRVRIQWADSPDLVCHEPDEVTMRKGTDKLTERQAEVLNFIIEHLGDQGYPPTVAEIADHFGFSSPNAAASHLNALRKKGYIRVEPRASRGIEVLRRADGAKQGATLAPSLPIIGRVAAGSPILAEEHIEGTIGVETAAFGRQADYLLRVFGDSMIELGIFEDDLVAIERTQDVRTGDVVVANMNGDVTLKTYRRKGTKVTLEPANAKLKPIEVNPSKDVFTIEGRAIGLLRSL